MTRLLLAALLMQSPADPLADRALAAAQQGDGPAAARLWQQAIAQDPRHYDSLFNYGVYLHRNGAQREAVALLDRAAAVRPGYQVHLIRGMNFQQLERREEAIRAWRQALPFQPRNVKLMQVLSVEYSRGRYFQEAAAIAREALKVAPDDENLYLLAIKAHHDAGDLPAAAELAAGAVRRFPNSARAQFEHGYYLQKRGVTETALQHLHLAMDLDPRYEEPFFFYGDLLVKLSQWEKALAPLRKALEIRPDYSPARVALSRALMNLGQLPAALDELKQAARLDPNNAQPWVMLSQIYFRMGQEDEARIAKETSLRLRRENPGVLEAAQPRPFPER
ncbi:MAG: tetratricopeptide repeat protein [Acidobacteria bacterium]|nr:tetratricopeptide repeat protein [Acidobacteriota bacterium]